MRRSWLRLGFRLAAAGAVAAFSMTGGLTALASGSFTGFNLSGDGGCHNLNPLTSISASTARPDNLRPWVQINDVSVGPGPTVTGLDGSAIPEAAITLNLCGTIPVFPTVNGDLGASWYVCFNPANNQSTTFRACVWTTDSANGGVASGVASWNAIVGYVNAGSAATPSTASVGASSFTMYLPYVWQQRVAGQVVSTQVIRPGDMTTNWAGVGYVTVDPEVSTGMVADFLPGYEVNGMTYEDSQGLGYDLTTGYHMDNVSIAF